MALKQIARWTVGRRTRPGPAAGGSGRSIDPIETYGLDGFIRAVTRLEFPHGFINPDHKHEYTHPELAGLLESAGFSIREAKGLCLFPESVARGVFDMGEGHRHPHVYDDIERCYLLYYRCLKV